MFQHSALPKSPVDIPRSLPRIGAIEGLTHLDRLVPLPTSLRDYLTWTIVMGIIGGLAFLQVWTTLRIAESDAELASLQLEYDLVQQQNAELLWRISHYTTLEYVERRAADLGFRPALQRQYITPERPPSPELPLIEARLAFPVHDSTRPALADPLLPTESGNSVTTRAANPLGQIDWSNPLMPVHTWWRPHGETLTTLWQSWESSLRQLPSLLNGWLPTGSSN